MTREEFAALVRRIETRHAHHPARLRTSVVLLAIFSYASLFVWLGISFLVAAPFFALGILGGEDSPRWAFFLIGGAIATIGVITVVAVLRVRIEPPKGLEIRRPDAPTLFATLDSLRAELRSAPVHRVVLSWACNAGVCATPRLGLLGWPRNHLELGLPLMEILSADELNGVLAHELAHISAQHGRIAGWIYRLRRSWLQAFAQGEKRATSGRVSFRPMLLKFFGWFWPRFSAHAFVLSRMNEFEADAVAARLCGHEHSASALLVIRLYDRLLTEVFWPELWRSTADEPLPPADVFDRLHDAIRAGIPSEQTGRWMQEAFRVFTSHDDTHPCLTERLQALGSSHVGRDPAGFFPVPTDPSAATVLFGDNLGRIKGELARLWQAEASENWQVTRARFHLSQERVKTLTRAVPMPRGNADDLWDQARAVCELHGDARAEALLRQVLTLRPAHAMANLYLGRYLLGIGDAAGEAHLERAMTANESLVPAAGGILSDQFTRNGQVERVRELRMRLDRHDARVAASNAERNSVTSKDKFMPHELTPEQLAPVCRALRKEVGIKAAFIGRKELKHFPEQRFFVLVVRLPRSWYALPDASKASAAAGRLVSQLHLPGRFLIVGEHGSFSGVARKVIAVENSKFYDVTQPGIDEVRADAAAHHDPGLTI